MLKINTDQRQVGRRKERSSRRQRTSIGLDLREPLMSVAKSLLCLTLVRSVLAVLMGLQAHRLQAWLQECGTCPPRVENELFGWWGPCMAQHAWGHGCGTWNHWKEGYQCSNLEVATEWEISRTGGLRFWFYHNHDLDEVCCLCLILFFSFCFVCCARHVPRALCVLGVY